MARAHDDRALPHEIAHGDGAAVTFTSVPAQVSRVNHAVPRTVATAERPRVTKRPLLSFPQSWRARGLVAVTEAVARDFAQPSGAASVSTVDACLPRVWRT